MRVVNFSIYFLFCGVFVWRFFFGWRCQMLRPWSALFFGSWLTRIPSENFFTSYCILHFVFIIVFFVWFLLFFVCFILIRGDLAEPHIVYMFFPLIYFILFGGGGSYVQNCSPRFDLIYSHGPKRSISRCLLSLASWMSAAEVII